MKDNLPLAALESYLAFIKNMREGGPVHSEMPGRIAGGVCQGFVAHDDHCYAAFAEDGVFTARSEPVFEGRCYKAIKKMDCLFVNLAGPKLISLDRNRITWFDMKGDVSKPHDELKLVKAECTSVRAATERRLAIVVEPLALVVWDYKQNAISWPLNRNIIHMKFWGESLLFTLSDRHILRCWDIERQSSLRRHAINCQGMALDFFEVCDDRALFCAKTGEVLSINTYTGAVELNLSLKGGISGCTLFSRYLIFLTKDFSSLGMLSIDSGDLRCFAAMGTYEALYLSKEAHISVDVERRTINVLMKLGNYSNYIHRFAFH